MAGVAAALVVLAGVLAFEAALAGRGPVLGGEPLDLDGRVGPGAGPALRMVWLGDSTAAGVGVDDPDEALPRLVAAELDRPVDLVVLAVSGATVADVVDDQVPALAGLDPEVVVVAVGANDVTHLTGRRAFERRYRSLVAAVPRGVVLVVLGVPDLGGAARLAQPLRAVAAHRGRALDDVIGEVAGDVGAIHVPIAAATGPAFRDDPDRYLAADRYHPSASGYRLWADAVLEVLSPALPADPRAR